MLDIVTSITPLINIHIASDVQMLISDVTMSTSNV